jgi:signal peptidase I
MRRPTIRHLIVFLSAAAVLMLLGRFVVSPYVVVGESMLPTLHPWEFCLMRRVTHYEPRRGEVVTFRTVDDPPLFFVKRVLGLPGETVSIERGVVKIDGVALIEPYTKTAPDWQMAPVTVPAGEVFVLGDNRGVPLDTTLHGLVANRLITTRLWWHWRWKR